MWIIPKNSQFYRFVRATADSNSDYREHWQTLLLSLLWRSKPTRWRIWLQRLKRVSWLSRLCTRICEPSRQRDFEDVLISSLRGTRASRSQSPASEPEQKTRDSFGRILAGSCRQYDLFLDSSRTSPDTLPSDSPKFTEAYEIWVTKLRQDCLRRQKSEPRTNGNGCLSWRTPAEQAAAIKVDKLTGGIDKRMYHKETGRLAQYGLEQQVNWPTPTERDHKNPCSGDLNRKAPGLLSIGQPAPARPSTNGKSRELLWQAVKCPGGGDKSRSGKRKGELLLGGQVGKGKLNPAWVEQLMGLPPGWTDLDCSETE